MKNDGKIRLLRILQLLREETDDTHPLSTPEIERILLERWNLEAYRITIQSDIEALIDVGWGIETIRSTQNLYYLAERPFELAEIKLLIDAVSSGRFITDRKSRRLTEKLAALASKHEAAALKRNVITDRIKAGNEQIYYIMDALNEAINLERKVRFLYFEFDENKCRKLRNGGEPYVISPYALTWNGDNYYVIGWSDKHEKVATFRVDRFHHVPEILEERNVPKPDSFSMEDFANQAFQLFNGELVLVELRCENSMMSTVVDHFGSSVKTTADGENHFCCMANVMLSPPFFAWVFKFGGRIRILSPRAAVEAYAQMLEKSTEAMREETRYVLT